MTSHDVELLPGTSPLCHPPYRTHSQKSDQVRRVLDYLLQRRLAALSQSPWASPCLHVPKADGQLRICTDYRRVNAVTVSDVYPLPRVDDLIDEARQGKFITKIYLLKGYYQMRVPLTERAEQISASVTPFEFFQYGMRNIPLLSKRPWIIYYKV